MLTIIDIIILVLLFGFALSGFVFGFIRSFGSLIATLISIYLATHYYQPASYYFKQTIFVSLPDKVSYFLAFILIFLLIDIVISLIFYFLDRFLNFISFLSFLKSINKIGGLIIGFLKGGFFIGIIIYVLTKYPLSSSITGFLEESKIVPLFLRGIEIVSPLIPIALKEMNSILIKQQ